MTESPLKDRTLAHLGVSCDGVDPTDAEGECYNYYEADVVVGVADEQDTRFGYIINLAVQNGWATLGGSHPLTALTFCPDHKDQAKNVKSRLAEEIL